jgi:predicted DNA-binding protein
LSSRKYNFFEKLANFLLVFPILLNMPVSTSFYLPDDFKLRLDDLSKSAGKNRTQYVIDAVTAYASGTMPDKKIIDLLNHLKADNTEIKKGIDDNHALLMVILKELQKS